MNEEALGTGQAISTQPTSQQSKVQVLTRGENSGPLGEMGLDKRLVLIPLVQGPAFDQLTTWRGRPFLLKIGLREHSKYQQGKEVYPQDVKRE